jgi:3-dehydroquinate dehydratase-1
LKVGGSLGVRGGAKGPGTTTVCTSVSGRTVAELAAKAQRAFDGGTDLVEFRVDSLRPPDSDEIRQGLSPFIGRSVLTVRPAGDGGDFHGSEERRLSLVKSLAGLRPELLDVELRTLEADPGILSGITGLRLVVSWHDSERTPNRSRLRSILERAESFGGIPKIVTTARNPADAIEVLSLYDAGGPAPVAFCMGSRGVFSRVMSMQLGSPLAYASLPGEPTAPGQLTLGQTLAIRRSLQVD